jgi:hypothetical protein
MTDFSGILKKIIENHKDDNKWIESKHEEIKRVSNSKVGSIGEEFIEKLCYEYELECLFPLDHKGNRARQSPWDIEINGVKIELKTATEDVSGSFQFNHIRYHRPYEAVICLGIAPSNIYFNIWSKADIVTGKAGNLVSMEKGGNASYKLTKKPSGLNNINLFSELILNFTNNFI